MIILDTATAILLKAGYTPEQAAQLAKTMGEAAEEYRSKQPEPDRRMFPTLQQLAEGARVPDWLKRNRDEESA